MGGFCDRGIPSCSRYCRRAVGVLHSKFWGRSAPRCQWKHYQSRPRRLEVNEQMRTIIINIIIITIVTCILTLITVIIIVVTITLLYLPGLVLYEPRLV